MTDTDFLLYQFLMLREYQRLLMGQRWRKWISSRIIHIKKQCCFIFTISRNNPNKRKNPSRLKQWTPRKHKHKRNLQSELLFYQKSPNFCEKDSSTDITGTSGRVCNRTSLNNDSCETLCCGRGYNLIKRKRLERCNCKFVWCCQVECDTCSYEEWISVCKQDEQD